MKLIQYAVAYIALLTLTKKELPYALSYEIVQLKQRIAPKAQFYTAEEQKLVQRFAALGEDGRPIIRDGVFTCRGESVEERAANSREYERLRGELNEVEDSEDAARRTFRLPADIRIAPEVIEALEPFVDFEVIE